MISSRLVSLALAFGGANLAQCLKVVDSGTFNGDRFVIQHVVTFGGPASNWDWLLSYIVPLPPGSAVGNNPITHLAILRAMIGDSHYCD